MMPVRMIRRHFVVHSEHQLRDKYARAADDVLNFIVRMEAYAPQESDYSPDAYKRAVYEHEVRMRLLWNVCRDYLQVVTGIQTEIDRVLGRATCKPL